MDVHPAAALPITHSTFQLGSTFEEFPKRFQHVTKQYKTFLHVYEFYQLT